MVCQICGKRSGFYPLCAEHFGMRDQGLVVKCKDCGKWYLKVEGCSVCKEEKQDSDIIMLQRELLERWGKRLFRIVKIAEEYAATDYDLERYNEIMEIQGDFREIWKDLEKPLVYLPKQQLQEWSAQLEDIAKNGLHFSDDRYDLSRYSDVLGIADEIREQVQSYAMELVDIPDPEPTSTDVSFVKDREILSKLLEMIDKAEKTILIASPWIWGIKEIEDKLTQVRDERNVSIRILTRRAGDDPYHEETVRGFHKRKFSIETADHLHAKIVIVDDKELYIGSANLVAPSMDRNLEAGICTNDPRTVSQAQVYFDNAFDMAFESRFTKSKN